jgi:anti-sigma B factor antagonist
MISAGMPAWCQRQLVFLRSHQFVQQVAIGRMEEREMEWSIVDLENGLAKVTLSGRMDLQGSMLIDPVFAGIAAEKSRVVVDMSDVTFLASLGLRAILVSCKALAAKGGNLVLLNPQPVVENVLNISGISSIIPVVADMGAAETILLT